MFTFTPIVKRLLVVNAAFLFVPFFLGRDLSRVLGLYSVLSPQFAPYQYISYMFIHADGWHLFGNMFSLIIFGSLLERFLGAKRFLILYVVCGVGAGVLYAAIDAYQGYGMQRAVNAYLKAPGPERFNRFVGQYAPSVQRNHAIRTFIEAYAEYPHMPSYTEESKTLVSHLFNQRNSIPMVGASGAVFGILMAFGMLFPNLQLFLLFPPIPIRAKYLVLFYGLYELWAEMNRMPGDNIAHWAHLSGMLVSFLLIKQLATTPPLATLKIGI